MVETTTLALLGIVAVALVIVIGLEETASAARTAGGGAARAAGSTAGLFAGGLLGGLMVGDALLQAVIAEPFALTTAVAGLAGAAGIAGLLGDITAIQFLAIGLTIFLAVGYLIDWGDIE